jgi:hypothetical protein
MLALMCCEEDLSSVLSAFHKIIGKEVIDPDDFLEGDGNHYFFLDDCRSAVSQFVAFVLKGRYKKYFEEVNVTGTVRGFKSEDFLEKAIEKFNNMAPDHYIDPCGGYHTERIATTSGPVYLPVFDDTGLFEVFSRFIYTRLSFEDDGLVQGEEVILKTC